MNRCLVVGAFASILIGPVSASATSFSAPMPPSPRKLPVLMQASPPPANGVRVVAQNDARMPLLTGADIGEGASEGRKDIRREVVDMQPRVRLAAAAAQVAQMRSAGKRIDEWNVRLERERTRLEGIIRALGTALGLTLVAMVSSWIVLARKVASLENRFARADELGERGFA